jgi:alanyl-tRNA synthetase
MTARDIRDSFIQFFREREHTHVPSSSLIPDDPTLPMFVNAGMNQFVPFFLGAQTPPFSPGRAMNSQKCIRAGGKHNDLEDVGLDTYHHTFFEMLGNWSFGDYFKEEAIHWAWDLLVGTWGFPKERLYFTVYRPGEGEPGEQDDEAYAIWEKLCLANDLDPTVHIQYFGKGDNFWMMGDTGPCGPCSEIHIDLTPNGDTGGKLVNADDHRCIEIWNLVFIQNNARPDGSVDALPACHVDTGMGFERAAAVMQCTNGFTDYSRTVSNYDTDVFEGLFGALQALSGHTYGCSLPDDESVPQVDRDRDIAFRVIADHIRCLTAAISDGIHPDRVDRGYVLRRILRRAVRYGRNLDLTEPFLHKLVDIVAADLGDVFPAIAENREKVTRIVLGEEESFGRTLDRGLRLFDEVREQTHAANASQISGDAAFKLYDTYGFPLDLTQLMAREAGLGVDNARFDELMRVQKETSGAGAGDVIRVIEHDLEATRFVGFDALAAPATVQAVLDMEGQPGVVLDATPFYAEKGGQVGDHGTLVSDSVTATVVDTQAEGEACLHLLSPDTEAVPAVGDAVRAAVDTPRRLAIQRHHTVTHLLHWALREVLGKDAAQQGSFVGPDYLRFDFNHPAGLSVNELTAVEQLVNERVLENASVHWFERGRREIDENPAINQFFGDKYGDVVRIVQIGGADGGLDGYSMELCGGTHTGATGDIGLFSIVHEGAISAGIRRIEAVAGAAARARVVEQQAVLEAVCGQLSTPVGELEKRVTTLVETQKRLEKELKALQRELAGAGVDKLLGDIEAVNGVPFLASDITAFDASPRDTLGELLQRRDQGIFVLGSNKGGKCAFVCSVSQDLVEAGWHAGTIAREVAKVAGGGGGGGAENAKAGGPNGDCLGDALARAAELVRAGV